jgi:hypothetical protein
LPKKRTFDPHAAKAQNKKIWYLRDQQVVATTSQKEQQAEAQEATTSPKDLQRLKAKPLQTERKRNSQSQNQNLFKATGLVMTNLKAVLGTAHHRAKKNHHQDQNLIQDAQPAMLHLKAVSGMAHHQAIKNHFHHAANPIRAGQPVMMTDQKEVLVQVRLPATGNLTLAGHHLARTKGQKEVSVATLPAKRNLIRLRAPEHHQILKTGPKEVLVLNQAVTVNLMQVQNQENAQPIKNLETGQPKVVLKNAKVLLNHIQAKGHHNVNQYTIK